MKSSHTNSLQKIKNMSFTSFKTLSNSPKVNQMYESLKYFAPIVHTNEKQMIDQIRSIGKQILEPERDIQIPKKNMEPVIEEKLNKSIDKLNIESNFNRSFYQNPKFGIDESFVNRSLTQSRQKSFLSERQKWVQIKKNINQRYSSRNHVTTPQNNLYDKYKFQVKMSKFKNFQAKAQNLKEDLKYVKNDKPNQQQKREQQQKFAKKQQLNYTKFVDKNIKKIVKQQKEYKDKKINQKQKFINVFDPKSRQYIKKPIKTHATKGQIQRSVEKINNQIIENQLKKHQKISKMREEQIKKEMHNVTFKPKLQTANYNSKNQFLRSKPSLQNFESRLTIDAHMRKSHQKQIIKQILEKSPFNPRLNPPSPHITSQSKIKSIWSTNQMSLSSNLSVISTQNLKKSSLLTDDKSIGQKSIPTTGISIKTSPQQLNFLFN